MSITGLEMYIYAVVVILGYVAVVEILVWCSFLGRREIMKAAY